MTAEWDTLVFSQDRKCKKKIRNDAIHTVNNCRYSSFINIHLNLQKIVKTFAVYIL